MKFFFIIVVLLLCCVYASDITLNPGPWANVATAVNNAAAGDIITLTTGVYTGCSQSAVISNNITILGTLAVVQCNDDGVPFRTSGNCDGALITGITFRSAISAILHDTPCRITASNIAVSYSVAGCAVVITNGASLDIKDSTITMNNNSGICVNNGSSAYISGTVISRNNAAVNASGGGGVYVGASSSLEMTYSRVFNNTARYGGGIFVNSDDATINLYSSVLSFNVADGSEGQGGAICIFASTYSSYSNNVLMMYNMTIVSNTAAASGGGVYMDAGAITIINTTMMYNYALYGGAMAVSDGTMTVMTSYFTLNRAEYGGVMDVWSNMIVHFINCTINKNEAEDGAVLGAADASSIYMTDTYITDNHDSNYGTIYMTDATYLSMKNCTCSLNTASDGACVAGIVDDASADIYDSLFTDNYSDDISGVFDVYMAHNIMVYNCTFHRNSAYYDGGVAFIGGSLGSVNFTYCNFVNNSAVYDDGGVIVVNGATLVLWSCILDNNTSLDDGGALYTMSSATVTMYNSSIIHGYSGYWGAAICVSGSSSYKTGVLNITDSIISYNTGTYNGGAIYISSGRVAVTITRCVLNNNVALDGGGGALYAYSQTNTSSLTILQSTMSYNSALDGGALLIRYFYDTNTTNGQAILSECNITHNTAHRGGGIVIVSSMGVLIDLKITGNKATVSNAGGLWVYGNSSLSMENVEISENSSPNGAFATTDSTVRINGTGVSITRNVGCGVSVVGSLSLVLDSTSSLCRNSVSQLCGTVSSSSIGTPNICGSMTVIPPSNAYRGYLYPGMIFTIDDGSSSSHVLYDESDSVTTVQLGDESLSVVINSNSVPFAVYVPSVITTTTGPIVVHTTSGLTSVSYDDYTFIPIHIDDCVLDPSRTTGPFPSRGTTDVARLAHFELSMNCKYLPIVRCFFGDIWEHATVDLDVAHCNVPVWHDPYVMPVMLEVVLPQHFYNVSSQFEFYKGLRPTSVTPQVAHTNITNITVCGIEYYEWATPRCLYSGLYYVPASYVGSGGVRCVICEYYSPDQCSSRVTNPIQVSLYGDQACDPLFITHVCMPSVGSDVVVIPSQVIMSNEMTLISVSIAGFNFYNSPSLMCRFDNQITKGSAANSNVMMCQLPLRNDGITSTVIVQVSNDGQNWVSTSHFTFTDGLYFCEPGFENRYVLYRERLSYREIAYRGMLLIERECL